MSKQQIDIDALVNELLPELLPDVVVDISNLIGYETTLKLVQAFGGVDFPMPKGEVSSAAMDKLIAAIGEDAARKLMQAFGGDDVYIPRCHVALIQLRNQEFRQKVMMMVESGDTQTAAIHLYAPQYGFTERWAYTVLGAESKRADTQLNLFDN